MAAVHGKPTGTPAEIAAAQAEYAAAIKAHGVKKYKGYVTAGMVKKDPGLAGVFATQQQYNKLAGITQKKSGLKNLAKATAAFVGGVALGEAALGLTGMGPGVGGAPAVGAGATPAAAGGVSLPGVAKSVGGAVVSGFSGGSAGGGTVHLPWGLGDVELPTYQFGDGPSSGGGYSSPEPTPEAPPTFLAGMGPALPFVIAGGAVLMTVVLVLAVSRRK